MGHCRACGARLDASLLACPSCHSLVHAEQLKRLASEARAAEATSNLPQALAIWRSALELLPDGSQQRATVAASIQRISGQLEASGRRAPASKATGRHVGQATAAGAFALVLWKFKFLLVVLLTKAKLLLLGLTKASTVFSMVVSLGVYWAAWGWRFALGVVAIIYVHEMGHVAALRRLGIRASAPMFIPGFGAFVQMRQHPIDLRENARVGLEGPWWGLGAAAICLAVFLVTGQPIWGAMAHVGGWLTLFNLLPVWQLDGSRGFAVLSSAQRWLVVATMAALWVVTKEGLLVLLAIVAGVRAFGSHDRPAGDSLTLTQWLGLLVISAALCRIKVPMP